MIKNSNEFFFQHINLRHEDSLSSCNIVTDSIFSGVDEKPEIDSEKKKREIDVSKTEETSNDRAVYERKTVTNVLTESLKSLCIIEDLYKKERGSEKTRMSLVVVGHVDAGKSTLMGHLLFKLGQVSRKTMHKFEHDSKKIGKSSFLYAWVLDETPEERNRGITMDVAETKFETSSKSVVLLDAPGHKDFIPNMITGAAQADSAIVVVDATRGEFETGFEAGGQTREHILLIRSLGVSQLLVAVNKMDNVEWSEERFRVIQSKLTAFLRTVGYIESDVTFVPCSGLSGENLTSLPESHALKKWYRGLTLIEVIDNFQPPERPVNKPLRMCINDVFKGVTGGYCLAGKIDFGCIRAGDKVLIMPAGEQGFVKSITVDEVSVQHCFAGDNAVVQITGVVINCATVGSVVCDLDRPIKATSAFKARLVIFNTAVPITRGFPVVLHYQSTCQEATIKNIVAQLDRCTGEVVKRRPRCLCKNTTAVVEIEVKKPICVELFQDFKALGRFMLRYGGATIAAGLVTAVK